MRSRFRNAAWVSLVSTLLVTAFPAAGRAASCYQTAKAVDICSSAVDDNTYVFSGAWFPAATVVGSSAYMLLGSSGVVRVWNLSDPMKPTGGSALSPKWTFDCEGNHTNLTLHVYPAVTLTDFPFALQPLSHWGWDWVSLGSSPAFTGTGYKPAGPITGRSQIPFSWKPGLFRHGTAVYAVGPLLDATAAAEDDRTVYLYKVFDGNRSPANYTAAAMTSERTALPTSGLSISVLNNPQVAVYIGERNVTGGTQRYAIIRSGSNAVVVDVTNPALPTKVANWSGGDSNLWAGEWAFDVDRWRILVPNTSASSPAVNFFNISEAGAPVFATSVALPTVASGAKELAVAGDLAVVGGGEFVDFLNLGTSPAQVLQPVEGINTLTRVCAFEAYGGDGVFDFAAMVKDGVHYAIRALVASGDIVRIDPSCISTVPAPKMSVTGGDPAADCTGTGAKGFPGDTFTITDTSGGLYESAYLRDHPAEPAAVAAPGSHPRAARLLPAHRDDAGHLHGRHRSRARGARRQRRRGPADDSDDHHLRRPARRRGRDQGGWRGLPGGSCDTWLQNDQLTVSAAGSEGNPTGYDWFIVPQSGGINGVELTGVEASFTLAETGDYHVFLVSHYSHTPPVGGGDEHVGRCASYDDTLVTELGLAEDDVRDCEHLRLLLLSGAAALAALQHRLRGEGTAGRGGAAGSTRGADPIVAQFDYKVTPARGRRRSTGSC